MRVARRCAHSWLLRWPANRTPSGLISWNEYSENTHVEPSTRYQDEALRVIAEFTGSPLVVGSAAGLQHDGRQ